MNDNINILTMRNKNLKIFLFLMILMSAEKSHAMLFSDDEIAEATRLSQETWRREKATRDNIEYKGFGVKKDNIESEKTSSIKQKGSTFKVGIGLFTGFTWETTEPTIESESKQKTVSQKETGRSEYLKLANSSSNQNHKNMDEDADYRKAIEASLKETRQFPNPIQYKNNNIRLVSSRSFSSNSAELTFDVMAESLKTHREEEKRVRETLVNLSIANVDPDMQEAIARSIHTK